DLLGNSAVVSVNFSGEVKHKELLGTGLPKEISPEQFQQQTSINANHVGVFYYPVGGELKHAEYFGEGERKEYVFAVVLLKNITTPETKFFRASIDAKTKEMKITEVSKENFPLELTTTTIQISAAKPNPPEVGVAPEPLSVAEIGTSTTSLDEIECEVLTFRVWYYVPEAGREQEVKERLTTLATLTSLVVGPYAPEGIELTKVELYELNTKLKEFFHSYIGSIDDFEKVVNTKTFDPDGNPLYFVYLNNGRQAYYSKVTSQKGGSVYVFYMPYIRESDLDKLLASVSSSIKYKYEEWYKYLYGEK
ncbi:MAG: hypothetical protein ACP5JC_02840, partial [Candidatus Micrarchaeia archaeon]